MSILLTILGCMLYRCFKVCQKFENKCVANFEVFCWKFHDLKILHSNCSHFMFNYRYFVLISLFHPSRKICHLYLTYCVVVSVSGSCSTKCFWLCPLFHFPWKQLSHSKSPRVPRSHLTHQGTILAALRTFTWSFIVL